MERKPSLSSKENGEGPNFVLIREGGTSYLFGPYKKGFAEHISETFGGCVLRPDPIKSSRPIFKKGDERE